MSVTLKLPNYTGLNTKETSTLNADASVGATSLTLLNNNNLAASDPFLIGVPGSETAELVTISSTTGAVIAITSATTLPHYQFDPTRALIGNQFNVYRAANINGLQPDDSTFASIAKVNIDPDQPTTTYIDASGSSNYWYKFTYFNSVTSVETQLADSGAARGGGIGNYCSIDDIREEAGFQNASFITDSMIDTQRQEAQAQVNSSLVAIYSVPFTVPINPMIAKITKLLAAGWLLINQYGAYGTTDTNSGLMKINMVTNKDGTGYLDKLKSQATTITDAVGNDISLPTGAGFAGWPTTETAYTAGSQGGSYRNFRMSDVQGGPSYINGEYVGHGDGSYGRKY